MEGRGVGTRMRWNEDAFERGSVCTSERLNVGRLGLAVSDGCRLKWLTLREKVVVDKTFIPRLKLCCV